MTAPEAASTSATRIGMRRGALGLVTAFAAICTLNPAHAQSHADRVGIYARTLSATTFAEQACPGFRADASRLDLLRAKAGISDSEDQTVADKMRESTASVTSAYERAGQSAWCADKYRQFGPRGTLAADALQKKP